MPAGMKKIMGLASLAIISVLIESVVGALIFYRASVQGILLNLYVVAGVCSVFAALIGTELQQIASGRAALEGFFSGIIVASRPKGPLAAVRSRIHDFLFFLNRVLCWPAFEMGLHSIRFRFGIALKTRFAKAASVTIVPHETSVSFYIVATAVVVTAWGVSVGEPSFHYAIYIFWMIIAAVYLKHLGYLFNPASLQVRLRRGQANPYLSYVFIAVADLAAIVLSFNGILNWNQGHLFDSATLQSTSFKLLLFKDFLEIFNNPPSSFTDYLIGFSGILFYLTLARSIMSFDDFRRRDSDYVVLAQAYRHLGMISDAKRILSISSPRETDAMIPRAMTYSSVGEYERSLSLCSGYFAINGLQPSQKFPHFITGTALVYFATPTSVFQNQTKQYFDFVVKYPGSDFLLLFYTMHLVTHLRYILSAPPKEIRQALATEELVGIIEKRELHKSLRFFYCFLMWINDREADVCQFLREQEASSSGEDRFAYLILEPFFQPFGMTTTDARRILKVWVDSRSTEAVEIACAFQDEFAKLLAADFIFFVGLHVNALGFEDLEKTIEAAVRRVRMSVKVDEVTEGILGAINLMESKATQPSRPIQPTEPTPA
jgi:hypothetical protein